MSSLPFKLLLFDLDGTLVTTGGAGLRALASTFQLLHGIDDVLTKVDPSGKTDPAIFREIYQVFLNRGVNDDELAVVSNIYLSHLFREIKKSPNYKVLPGVRDFLDQLGPREDVVVGLGTGNLEKGARIKLEPAGLNPYFESGGFGSDAENRAKLLKVGRDRAARSKNQEIADNNVFVIGDTELDVRAAQAAGFKSVAVATGSRKKEDLAKSNPDYLLADLSQGGNFLDQIGRSIEAN